jgi:hypothetical protein
MSKISRTELWWMIYSHFNDSEKTKLWFNAPNPLLGNISPNEMLILGREEKLKDFIISQLNDNVA